MQINIIAIGTHMPAWVNLGFEEYAKRLKELQLKLIEIPMQKRGKNADLKRIIQQEGQQMLAAIPQNHTVIALDVLGQAWDTSQFAQQLQTWREEGRGYSFLIGGPEGLAPACQTRAEYKWSLSPLTLPHPLVRIVIAEQLYRAWSILTNHPYHRYG